MTAAAMRPHKRMSFRREPSGGSHQPAPPLVKDATVMEGERELSTGLLSKDASFRLIVSGPIGGKEIERLIRKLELDKQILADEAESENKDEPNG
jgi:hypothetical protein